MARRKGPSTTKVDPAAFDQAGAQVFDNPVKTEIEDSYLEYAYSVIHSRALPDARDGLKPVHRRILFSMNEQGYRPTHAYVKSSRVVGDCFVRGALVSTPDGLRPIETVELGDLVLDGAGRPVPVVAVYENPASDLVRVTWTNGHTMLVTPGQRFRTVDDDLTVRWTEARDLIGRRTVGYGAGRHPQWEPNGEPYHYVLGLVLAKGSVGDADGRVRIHLRDAEPLDVAHGWAIETGVTVSRGKREASEPDGRDEHILTFARHDGLLAAGEPDSEYRRVPDSVLSDRAAWLPFLAGLFDGRGRVRRADREIVFVSAGETVARQVYSMLADRGIHARRWTRAGQAAAHAVSVSGRDAAVLGRALLPWTRIGHKQDALGAIVAEHGAAPGGVSVESVEVVESDATYDIQVGSHEHAFVVEGFVVHNCMGKYHPHGDTAIYDAMVRLAQDFSLNAPLIDGHGNFGSPDDGPAASRYTEARMSAEAMLLVGELGEDTVDFRPNYDGSLMEPTVLPAAFPNLLVNGTSGIAVGMATNMIPHNLGEVVAAARWLLMHPDATLDKLMEFVPGPDLPTGGMLLGLDEVRKAYETGRGVVRMRAKVEIGPLEGSRGRQAITVTELPYQVGSEKIIEKITDEVTKSKRLTGIADVKDLTDRENGTRLVIECKVGVNPQALLADLYRLTPMEQSFGINNLVLVDGQPRTLGLKALLEVFLRHRAEVVTRRTRYRRRKREERLHLVEGLLRALLDIDKVIKLIRGSEDAAAAKAGLMSRFKLSEIQATYILDTPLRRLTRYDKLELEAEQDKLRAEIEELSKILDDEKVLRRVVSTELGKVAKDLTAERRTALIDGDLKEVLAASKPAGPLEVADDPCQVVLSATGLVARTAAESEEATEGRRRRGRARHDTVAAVVHSTARGQVLLVTNRGRAVKTDVLPLPVLPEQSGTVSLSGGMAASELVPLDKGEKVVGIAPLGEQAAGSPGLALGTRHGVVKVCAPEWPVRSEEFEVISLKDGDEVVGATWLTDGTETLVFVSSEASLLRFAAGLVRPQGLKGGGMAGMTLPGAAKVAFFGAVRTDDPEHGEPMVVTSTGQSVKVTPFAEYPAKGRATGGVRAHRFLKGEAGLVLAWVGPRPAGASRTGSAIELPEPDPRRDGSGAPHPGPDVVGHLIERD
ncbi:DNA topoisomerase (ATP-hydrolyzing) [Actinokineospora iranica]|uniref:DNA gyrase subunit A n=1 Tax=Actinokineospora iranica TaxID=1271860 RepID=A0A1G6YT38_9PSEU|nr:DNA topoisomerase (ATP-hydrolyzing) [Actinokineospora iranica]SDD93528.1 DNA gyrase subunit A [Actinokineospora iranica]